MNVSLFEYILGPVGALVVTCLAIWGLYVIYKREAARVDKLDDITAQALGAVEQLLDQQKKALFNHDKILENQTKVLGLGERILSELEHAKEREEWTKDRKDWWRR